MDAEHLMALKHTKRIVIPPEAPMPMSTPKARKFKEESSEDEEIGFVPHNRGHKLKRRANPITGGCRLLVPESGTSTKYDDENEDDNQSNFRRSLNSSATIIGGGPSVSKSASSANKWDVIQIRPVVGSESANEVGEELSDDENPYAGIKINEILSPLETSTEILQKPQLRRIFQSPQLQIMAVHAMAMIEREKMVNKMMSRVALILQGDDPMYPQLGYGMGEGCSTAYRGMPDQEELINGNKEWKKNGEDKEQVQKTLSLLMENINCSNQYIDLLNESRDAVNHVSKQKRLLWKKLKEKRERMRRRMHPK
ncbi:hypothetical protein BGZ80_000384 [Entomortierella chlamydospora]|uniref:Transcriptional regulatory protein RXT2 N-terminal domain-containing protein n=1 Tax=Entomortierella chlamydospora TaxID=101097 RepID=A0A9P6MS90_9FUNG|nr:hypothetical protein BGZ80_000384 [Entomortierella chlamydospora]